MTWKNDADAAMVSTVLAKYDHKPTWKQNKTPSLTKVVRGHLRQFRSDETDLINAYGVHGVEIICDAASFPTAPIKFDEFDLNGEVYTVNDVRIQNGFDNTPIVYRCLCKGI